ncbi:MAG: hypothetical protein HWN81_06230 [Candidatus Lokiarchaeota archaeon]|nr:hypothetical protein [Candidatus Lokiarchaeota archaeon]
MNDKEEEEEFERKKRDIPIRFKDFKQLIQERDEAIEDKVFIEFKLRWGELTNEAMKILNKIKELEGESAKLMERKKAGEFVKDLLKQNKIELKQLKKREMKIYLESEKILRNEREREHGKFLRVRNMWPGPIPPFNLYHPQEKKRNTLNNIYEFITEEDQLVFFNRRIDLANKLRMESKRLCIVVILVLFLPIIFVVIMMNQVI